MKGLVLSLLFGGLGLVFWLGLVPYDTGDLCYAVGEPGELDFDIGLLASDRASCKANWSMITFFALYLAAVVFPALVLLHVGLEKMLSARMNRDENRFGDGPFALAYWIGVPAGGLAALFIWRSGGVHVSFLVPITLASWSAATLLVFCVVCLLKSLIKARS